MSDQQIHELLKPRYEVIADYPKSIYQVGTIVRADGRSEDLIYCDWEGPRMRDYPHLFRRMQWWERREPGEMPEYVKHKTKMICLKVAACDAETEIFISETGERRYIGHYLPAAASDYQTLNEKK